jgi:hypothetical protein
MGIVLWTIFGAIAGWVTSENKFPAGNSARHSARDCQTIVGGF